MASPTFAAPSSTTGWQKVTTGTGSNVGNVNTGVNGVVVSDPIATPGTGSYTGAQSVTLSAPGANKIHYMLNKPVLTLTCGNGELYSTSTPISVTAPALLRIIACYGSGSNSTTTNSDFTYSVPSSSGGNSGGGYIAPTATAPIPGDTNGDGVVNILDFNTLITHWGQNVTNGATDGDFNGDGVVNILDFNILITNWTK